jgi:hypothetical protein
MMMKKVMRMNKMMRMKKVMRMGMMKKILNMMMKMTKLLVFRNNNIVHPSIDSSIFPSIDILTILSSIHTFIYHIHQSIYSLYLTNHLPIVTTHLPSIQVLHTLQFVSYMDHPLLCMTQEHHEHYN